MSSTEVCFCTCHKRIYFEDRIFESILCIFQCATKMIFMRLIKTLISTKHESCMADCFVHWYHISWVCWGQSLLWCRYCKQEYSLNNQHYTEEQIAAFILHTLEHILTSILSSKQNKLFNNLVACCIFHLFTLFIQFVFVQTRNNQYKTCTVLQMRLAAEQFDCFDCPDSFTVMTCN